MMRKVSVLSFALLCSLMPAAAWLRHARAQTASHVVRGVLFYSPTCPKCVEVMNEYLKTLFDQYGSQLHVVGIDATTPEGRDLYLAAVARYAIPEDRQGVPTLIVGEAVMVGTWEIPQQFPDLIAALLVQGGADWPDIPGLQEVIAEAGIPSARPLATSAPNDPSSLASSTAQASGLTLLGEHDLGWQAKFALDPLGNGVSVLVLAGMLAVLVAAGIAFRRIRPRPLTTRRSWWIPVLCAAGFGVAAYLGYVETARVEAFCGPVGDCNTVQESPYARLFGVLPVGILGMAGYILIGLAWYLGRSAAPRLASYAALVMLGMTTSGTLFSVYLTFLEPFVIGATCAWCLTSAVVMTLLFWLSLAPARAAWTVLPQRALPVSRRKVP
jgi:uncharacterized membrane protein